jgi:hypothetical protein
LLPWLVVQMVATLAGCPAEQPIQPDYEDADAGAPVALRCVPTVSGPSEVLEGNTIALHFDCGAGGELPPSGLEMESMPEGAVFDADEGVLRWTPRLDQAGTYTLTLRFSSTGQELPVRISVLDRWFEDDEGPRHSG